MVLASYVRLVLFGTALLASQAQATFDFSSCAANCVSSSGCKTDNTRCMCKEARDLLLDSVISCLFFNCKDDLRNFEDAFLDPIEEGCEDSHREIPSSKLKAAESLASSYISKIPASTKAEPSTPEATPTQKLTTKASSASSSTTEESSPSSTSEPDRGLEEPTSAAEETTVTPTLAAPPAPSTESAATTPAPAGSGSGSGSGSGFDTDPFGSVGGGSAGSHVRPLLFSLLGLPLAAGILALR